MLNTVMMPGALLLLLIFNGLLPTNAQDAFAELPPLPFFGPRTRTRTQGPAFPELPPEPPTQGPDLTPELKCGLESMEVGLSLAQLEAAGLDPSSAHLADRVCSPEHQNRNQTVWYQVERTDGTCGNTLTINGSHAIYSNSLFVYLASTLTLVPPHNIHFTCIYPLETDASLDTIIRPYLARVEDGLSGVGPEPRATMSLYHSAKYSQPYPAGPVDLPLGSTLFVGVSVEEIERDRFAVVLENCYATHSANPDDSVRHYLIQNKCPSDRRQVAVSKSGSSLEARFSALLFLFQGDYRNVFLHCSLSLCDKKSPVQSCSPICSGRRRRSLTTSKGLLKPVTIGPVNIQ